MLAVVFWASVAAGTSTRPTTTSGNGSPKVTACSFVAALDDPLEAFTYSIVGFYVVAPGTPDSLCAVHALASKKQILIRDDCLNYTRKRRSMSSKLHYIKEKVIVEKATKHL